MSTPKPIWTVNIRGKIYWTDSEESCLDIIKALGGCEYKKTTDGTWDDLVKTVSTLQSGVKGKICGYDGTLCNLVICNDLYVSPAYCQKMDDRI